MIVVAVAGRSNCNSWLTRFAYRVGGHVQNEGLHIHYRVLRVSLVLGFAHSDPGGAREDQDFRQYTKRKV